MLDPLPPDDIGLLRAVGVALHGPSWRRAVARGLGLSGGYVAALDAGLRPLTDDTRRALSRLAAREAVEEVERSRRRLQLLAAARDRFGITP